MTDRRRLPIAPEPATGFREAFLRTSSELSPFMVMPSSPAQERTPASQLVVVVSAVCGGEGARRFVQAFERAAECPIQHVDGRMFATAQTALEWGSGLRNGLAIAEAPHALAWLVPRLSVLITDGTHRLTWSSEARVFADRFDLVLTHERPGLASALARSLTGTASM